ncbi:hypothetical protein RP726_08505 [Candidatus Methylospira mobilis]|uniref:KGGVGR-motif variant AAA ATPase n=1 Tax=Candidatus Methylospira mobilis TaxID=1808979 RepID=UPI0028E9DFFB|nr:hypothetical protein [Candidatus Methylospira mobilis]WNV06431.1 hypothetical protein RP726_08505 [Candidatus Methylospira mobilis]
MNTMSLPKRLLTWLDVERSFKTETSNFTHFEKGITSIHCYFDGAEVEFNSDEATVTDWLHMIFGRTLTCDGKAVTLDIGAQPYPIELVKTESATLPITRPYPLWREQVYLNSVTSEFPEVNADGPDLVTFHSFKGGVGRTTSLMTYASAILGQSEKKPVRLLLIDADLEAPGISFWLDPTNKPTVSFLRLVEALHYPPLSVDSTLDYFAGELRKTSLNIDSANREIFVLPAALDVAEIMDMPVQPEHIARNLSNPWLLSDHLRALGRRLEVNLVFVDLRAGLSELASPLLFDPRVEHFFVTTVAHQSITGMVEILKRLYAFQKSLPDERRSRAKPSIILNLLTPELKQSPDYAEAVQRLNVAYQSADDESDEDAMSPVLDWIESDFEPRLMSLRSVKQALDYLRTSSLYHSAASWAKSRNAVSEPLPKINARESNTESNKLFNLCERLQFAEKSTSGDMLITDPLRNLAKHYGNELPNVISVGAKGAGKTFTFLQLCKTQSWESFLQKMGVTHQAISDGMIFPLLASSNVDGDSRNVVDEARKVCINSLFPGETSSPGGAAAMAIKSALLDHQTDWDVFWVSTLLGLFPAEASSLSDLNSWLVNNNRSVVFVVDGIEDVFDTPDDENQKRAIKSLLLLPNQLGELDQRRIGLVCFVRADYVQLALRQNIAQYLARFQAFRLEWTPEAFLRLTYWICGKAEIIGADAEQADRLTTEQLLAQLEKLWGKKMGRDDSKEAYTARWVFAALCDLNGRLQARDLVRFLRFSAKQTVSVRTAAWPDRVLAPDAIRKSLPECSVEKVSEAASEIKALFLWRERLAQVDADNRKVPFGLEAVGLSDTTLLSVLRDLGIVYEDTERLDNPARFYLPEVYRAGLGFSLAGAGRPRIQALLKRNLGGMPF